MEERRGWWRPTPLGLSLVLCGLLVACGGNTPSTPTTPLPSPAAPAPTPLGTRFLHVLQGESIVTYRIDGATGRLQPSTRVEVGEAHTITGEPLGRYVYAGFGPRYAEPSHDGPDPTIVAYAPDARSGGLLAVSQANSEPIVASSMRVSGEWYWLSASSARVYAMWVTGTYHDSYHTYVTHAVGQDGRLGPAYEQEFNEGDPGGVAIDVDSGAGADVFYKATWTGGLSALFVEPDGRLTQMGGSHLCVASPTSYTDPLVAVSGFLFASAYVGPQTSSERTVCSYEGPRLAPRGNLALQSERAVAVAPPAASSGSRPAPLVAMAMRLGATGQFEVRVFAMGPGGDLLPLDSFAGPGWARHLLFHPSGRVLYASHAEAYADPQPDLTVYSIDAQGRLAVVQELEHGGGTMAVSGR